MIMMMMMTIDDDDDDVDDGYAVVSMEEARDCDCVAQLLPRWTHWRHIDLPLGGK